MYLFSFAEEEIEATQLVVIQLDFKRNPSA